MPIRFLMGAAVLVSCFAMNVTAQSVAKASEALDLRQQSIVTISAFTAKGDLVRLSKAINEGLDAGLKINEIKEVLVQLYAYAGFPRSLNALTSFMAVLKERKSKGINDPLGKEATPLTTNRNRLQFGTDMQTKLIGRPISGEVYQFSPAIDQFLKEHLFGDIFGRDNLDWKNRELATISALASLGGAENQLRSHLGVGMYNGLTEAQLHHTVAIIQSKVDAKDGNIANKVLHEVLKLSQDKTQNDNPPANRETDPAAIIFPKGEKITNNNFIGTAWLQQMVLPDSLNSAQVGTVTFEPGARSNWHFHPGGQILIITSGTGYYQEKGSSKRIIKKGDVIKCAPNIPHWHGASKDEQLVQVAITNTVKGGTEWMQAVTELEYNN